MLGNVAPAWLGTDVCSGERVEDDANGWSRWQDAAGFEPSDGALVIGAFYTKVERSSVGCGCSAGKCAEQVVRLGNGVDVIGLREGAKAIVLGQFGSCGGYSGRFIGQNVPCPSSVLRGAARAGSSARTSPRSMVAWPMLAWMRPIALRCCASALSSRLAAVVSRSPGSTMTAQPDAAGGHRPVRRCGCARRVRLQGGPSRQWPLAVAPQRHSLCAETSVSAPVSVSSCAAIWLR